MTDITNATEVEAKREPWPTLYIAVRRDDDEPPYFWTSPARSTADEARDHFYDTCRVFRIPSTADAERAKERERLIGNIKAQGSCYATWASARVAQDMADAIKALAAFDAANGGRGG